MQERPVHSKGEYWQRHCVMMGVLMMMLVCTLLIIERIERYLICKNIAMKSTVKRFFWFAFHRSSGLQGCVSINVFFLYLLRSSFS